MKLLKNETFLGVLFGFFISAFISGTLVIAAAKAGITPGVSPLVILVGWVVFSNLLKGKTKKFLAISQVTGSAGAAVTAGIVFTAPAIQLMAMSNNLEVPGVDVFMLIIASLSGTFLGFGFVGLATKKFLRDPKLPAPEAVACDRMIKTAAKEIKLDETLSANADGKKPVSGKFFKPRLKYSLVAGLMFGAVTHLMEKLTLIKEDVGVQLKGLGTKEGLMIPASALFIGIGGLLTLSTAIMIFIGSFLNYSIDVVVFQTDADVVERFTRWVGAGAMTVAVVFSLFSYFVMDRKKYTVNRKTKGVNEKLLEIDKRSLMLIIASIILGIGLLIGLMMSDFPGFVPFIVILIVSVVVAYLMSNLGALLSLQVGSSASPVSGTVFIALLIISVFALLAGLGGAADAIYLMPMIIAICVAVAAANDSSQDYKTLQLNGYPARIGFIPQLVGLLAGAIVVPLVLYVAYNSYGFGSGPTELACPQASFYSGILSALFISENIPWTPVLIGIGFGFAAVVTELIGKTKGLILSSLAFAVGIYLPSVIGIGIMIGAFAKYAASGKQSAKSNEG
ncbi:MAG: OPT/YSL family transporter, partial [Planctomycetes bacterium]|nr:OPT/YSL family transporter [Planctomycetota bacterium]